MSRGTATKPGRNAATGAWAVERYAQVKEEPAQRAGRYMELGEQNALASGLL